jgi:hypothetical protein
MDAEKIKSLLEKYFEGETALEEEKALAAYFNSDRVGEELKKYQPLFAFFAQEKQIVLPSKKQQPKLIKYDFRKILEIKRIAAILILVAGSFWWFNKQKIGIENPIAMIHKTDKLDLNDTEETPEQAYLKAKAALMLVSSKMKRGTDEGSAGIHLIKTSLDKIK